MGTTHMNINYVIAKKDSLLTYAIDTIGQIKENNGDTRSVS